MSMADSSDLSRDYARLMLVMRRMIREEFAVTIHLDEPGAGEELLLFAGRSEAPVLKEMALELEEMLNSSTAAPPPPAEDGEEPAGAVTYYRGAPIKVTEANDGGNSGTREGSTRIYRGQKVAN